MQEGINPTKNFAEKKFMRKNVPKFVGKVPKTVFAFKVYFP